MVLKRADDTGEIMAIVSSRRFKNFSERLADAVEGRSFFLVKGKITPKFRSLDIVNIKYIGDDTGMTNEMASIRRKSD